MNSNYSAVVDSLLPIGKSDGEFVAYRFVYEFLVKSREYSFVIDHGRAPVSWGSRDYLGAHVRIADTKPIRKQLTDLHASSRGETLSEITKRIRLKTWHLSEERCPAIRRQFEAFQKIQFKSPRFSTVILDAPEFEILAESSSGIMKLNLSDWEDPAVIWANETRQALAECGASESALTKNAE